MAAAKNIVAKARTDLEARLKELAPYVEEYQEVESALSALSGNKGRRRSSRGRQPKRAQEFLALVSENPGITVAEAAEKMGDIQPNYLYRVAGQEAKRGNIRKEGKGYHPVVSSS